MGILKFQQFICTEKLMDYCQMIFQYIMSRDKFKHINRILKLGDASDNDKLPRIRISSEIISSASLKYYTPGKNLAINKSMATYKRLHNLK